MHDDVIKWKYFPRYWPFVRGIHRSLVNSPHKGQWRGALMFTLICARINVWVNNRKAGDLRRNRVHYDVIVMCARLTDRSWYDSYITSDIKEMEHSVHPLWYILKGITRRSKGIDVSRTTMLCTRLLGFNSMLLAILSNIRCFTEENAVEIKVEVSWTSAEFS